MHCETMHSSSQLQVLIFPLKAVLNQFSLFIQCDRVCSLYVNVCVCVYVCKSSLIFWHITKMMHGRVGHKSCSIACIYNKHIDMSVHVYV